MRGNRSRNCVEHQSINVVFLIDTLSEGVCGMIRKIRDVFLNLSFSPLFLTT